MTELMMLDHPAVYNHTDDNREQRTEPRRDTHWIERIRIHL